MPERFYFEQIPELLEQKLKTIEEQKQGIKLSAFTLNVPTASPLLAHNKHIKSSSDKLRKLK